MMDNEVMPDHSSPQLQIGVSSQLTEVPEHVDLSCIGNLVVQVIVRATPTPGHHR